LIAKVAPLKKKGDKAATSEWKALVKRRGDCEKINADKAKTGGKPGVKPGVKTNTGKPDDKPVVPTVVKPDTVKKPVKPVKTNDKPRSKSAPERTKPTLDKLTTTKPIGKPASVTKAEKNAKETCDDCDKAKAAVVAA